MAEKQGELQNEGGGGGGSKFNVTGQSRSNLLLLLEPTA